MLEKDQNLSAREEVDKIVERLRCINLSLKMMFSYFVHTQEAYTDHCKSIYKNTIAFEGKISKASFYSTEKTKQMLILSEKYRELPSRIETLGNINLEYLSKLNKYDDVFKTKESKLLTSTDVFNAEFTNYTNSISEFNLMYERYKVKCTELNEIIKKFKSYNDPLYFYNKKITSNYQGKLEKYFNHSKNEETKLKTELQLLDNKRVSLNELLKNIRESFTEVFHACLKFIEKIIKVLADPSRNEEKGSNNSPNNNIENSNNSNHHHSEIYKMYFEKLNTFQSNIDEAKELMNDFGDIIKHGKNSTKYNLLISDEKLFYSRCENLKTKKEKAYMETLNLQASLIELMNKKLKDYKSFDKEFKEKEKKIFMVKGKVKGGGSGGSTNGSTNSSTTGCSAYKENFKQLFKKHFGEATFSLLEIGLAIVDSPKQFFEKVHEMATHNIQSLKSILTTKQESITKFNKLYNEIMEEHLKIKKKYEISTSSPSATTTTEEIEDIALQYQTNITETLDKFKLIFSEIDMKETRTDEIATEKLTNIYEFIEHESKTCLVSNILLREQSNVNVMKKFNITKEAMHILTKDPLYSILFEDVFSPNLEKKFQSQVNQEEYDNAYLILKQKEEITKKMLKRELGCCGLVQAKPINNEIIYKHSCEIIIQESNHHHKGVIKILKEGLTFEENFINNPLKLKDKVHILIPNSDIICVENKALEKSEAGVKMGIALKTLKGIIVFVSKEKNEEEVMYNELEKLYGCENHKKAGLEKSSHITAYGNCKNSSTDSTSVPRKMISNNKQQSGSFSEEPINQHNGNGHGSMDQMVVKGTNRGGGSKISEKDNSTKHQQPDPTHQYNYKELSKQEKSENLKSLKELIKHFEKRQFLNKKEFHEIKKEYKNTDRKDYYFKESSQFLSSSSALSKEPLNNSNPNTNSHHFILKERKKHTFEETTMGTVLQITYEWKITFPENSSLLSFLHGENITLNLNVDQPLITIVEWPRLKEQIFNRHKFYEKISEMNQNIVQYMNKNTGKEFVLEMYMERVYDPMDDTRLVFPDEISELMMMNVGDYSVIDNNNMINNNVNVNGNNYSKSNYNSLSGGGIVGGKDSYYYENLGIGTGTGTGTGTGSGCRFSKSNSNTNNNNNHQKVRFSSIINNVNNFNNKHHNHNHHNQSEE